MIKFSEKYLKWNRVFLSLLFILLFFFILSCYSKKGIRKEKRNLISNNAKGSGKYAWDTIRIVHEQIMDPITQEDSLEMVMKNMKMSIQRYLYFTEDTFNYKIRVDSLYDSGFSPDNKILDSVMKIYYNKKRK